MDDKWFGLDLANGTSRNMRFYVIADKHCILIDEVEDLGRQPEALVFPRCVLTFLAAADVDGYLLEVT